jgi:hypothetical protein
VLHQPGRLHGPGCGDRPGDGVQVLTHGRHRGAHPRNPDEQGNIKVGGEIVVQNIVISSGGTTVALSTQGFQTVGPVKFSSGVVILGDVEVRSTRAKAVYVPYGGLIISEETPGNSAAPGRLTSPKVQTSTITLKGSAIIFLNDSDVAVATMTSTALTIEGVNAGKLQNRYKGSGAPAAADCDQESEEGLQYYSRTPSRLYICADNGSGGYEWRYTNISP